jgi:hypothetical protein
MRRQVCFGFRFNYNQRIRVEADGARLLEQVFCARFASTVKLFETLNDMIELYWMTVLTKIASTKKVGL